MGLRGRRKVHIAGALPPAEKMWVLGRAATYRGPDKTEYLDGYVVKYRNGKAVIIPIEQSRFVARMYGNGLFDSTGKVEVTSSSVRHKVQKKLIRCGSMTASRRALFGFPPLSVICSNPGAIGGLDVTFAALAVPRTAWIDTDGVVQVAAELFPYPECAADVTAFVMAFQYPLVTTSQRDVLLATIPMERFYRNQVYRIAPGETVALPFGATLSVDDLPADETEKDISTSEPNVVVRVTYSSVGEESDRVVTASIAFARLGARREIVSGATTINDEGDYYGWDALGSGELWVRYGDYINIAKVGTDGAWKVKDVASAAIAVDAGAEIEQAYLLRDDSAASVAWYFASATYLEATERVCGAYVSSLIDCRAVLDASSITMDSMTAETAEEVYISEASGELLTIGARPIRFGTYDATATLERRVAIGSGAAVRLRDIPAAAYYTVHVEPGTPQMTTFYTTGVQTRDVVNLAAGREHPAYTVSGWCDTTDAFETPSFVGVSLAPNLSFAPATTCHMVHAHTTGQVFTDSFYSFGNTFKWLTSWRDGVDKPKTDDGLSPQNPNFAATMYRALNVDVVSGAVTYRHSHEVTRPPTGVAFVGTGVSYGLRPSTAQYEINVSAVGYAADVSLGAKLAERVYFYETPCGPTETPSETVFTDFPASGYDLAIDDLSTRPVGVFRASVDPAVYALMQDIEHHQARQIFTVVQEGYADLFIDRIAALVVLVAREWQDLVTNESFSGRYTGDVSGASFAFVRDDRSAWKDISSPGLVLQAPIVGAEGEDGFASSSTWFANSAISQRIAVLSGAKRYWEAVSAAYQEALSLTDDPALPPIDVRRGEVIMAAHSANVWSAVVVDVDTIGNRAVTLSAAWGYPSVSVVA